MAPPAQRAKEVIARDLGREERLLADMEVECAAARSRIESLRAELNEAAALAPVAAPTALSLPLVATSPIPQTPADKVKLFRTLFRGRVDVFPLRFVSKKTGDAGYAPECSNKWEAGLCILKTGGKCGDCSNQAFAAVTDEVISLHLQGRHTAGVYPLLEDDRCWFLAADFDKANWKEDVGAFAETCRLLGLPVAVERSRSGDGAHAWFFFAAPVLANVARRMGCYLLTETMSRRHELAMASYDRLFPNQDTMPRGGLGNLIALPLQGEPRRQGNSVFLDERLEPIPDQWAFLASVPRLEPSRVEAIAQEATKTGRVLGLRFADSVDDEELLAPWSKLPSGRRARKRIVGPMPSQAKAVLSQRLFIEKAALPSALLNELKRLAAFQNPAFYKNQKMRLSTAMTPRVIACAEDLPKFVSLPRGLVREAEQLLAENGVKLALEDLRGSGEPLKVKFTGELTAVQKLAARALLAEDTGVFVGPPGIGKTVLGTFLVAERARSTLILVHRKPLLEQWVAQLAMFLGVDEKEVGQIGGGKRKPNGLLDVAMIQSLVRQEKVEDLVASYGHVIVDECHHLPAQSFERVLSAVKARYVTGLTATPQRRDGHHPITEMQLGPIRFQVAAKELAASRPFDHKLIVRETAFQLPDGGTDAGIQEIYGALARDEARNRKIVDDVIVALREGRSPLLLTERRAHLDTLAAMLKPVALNLVVLRGGMTAKEHRGSADQLASIPAIAERVVLAMGKYIGEGFDDARLDTLFLAMPISWKGTLIQYSGRLHRAHKGKTEVRVYDYVDREVPMLLRMFKKRLPTYRAIGYARGEAPLGFAEPKEDRTIEYDEEALRHFAEQV